MNGFFLERKIDIEKFISSLSFTYLTYALYTCLGLLLLFYGRRVFHLFLALAGLTSGLALANQLNMHFMHLNNEFAVGFYLVIALATALLFSLAYRFSFFLAGTSIAIYYSIFLFRLYMPGQNPPWLYVLAISIIAGTIAGIFREKFLALGSAAAGAILVADSIYGLSFKQAPAAILRGNFESLNHIANRIILLILLICTISLGFIFQMKKVKGKRLKRH